ncbi:DEKNAAC101829 [Brettanomyces naardenensis]|uniref:Mitochondrial intermediate peptidase n=1 Tax=Brettanomyces naardenensis TaxID=13370 RepID=A0A448YJ93_BRENA|nr:DEKNAAC101829 [Brettanomyces naardenensis]
MYFSEFFTPQTSFFYSSSFVVPLTESILSSNVTWYWAAGRAAGRAVFRRSQYSRRWLNTDTHIDTPTAAAKSQLIRQVFDDDTFWHKFNGSSLTDRVSILGYIGGSQSTPLGLFENPYLKKPSGLRQFSAEALEKANLLTKRIIEDDSPEGLRNCVRNLDRLSDILCRVIDLCEFVRVVHPDQSFVKAAQSCHEQMFEFMNVLNTSEGLFLKLERVLSDKTICSQMSEEELAVGKLLYADFKQSGIDLDQKTRQGFVELSQYIAMTGQAFNNGVSETDAEYAVVPKKYLREGDIPKEFEQSVSYDRHGNLRVPVYGRIPYEILRSCPNRNIRERIWVCLHSVPKPQIQLLERLLRSRGILARMMGKDSYAEYQLKEKMAKNPANVMIFLQNLLKETKKGVASEVRTLYKGYPNREIENPSDEQLSNLVRPWDRDYLTTLHMVRQKSSNLEDISAYFSVGTVVAGLSSLFKSIYGIELRPKPVQKDETWSGDVRKFEVVSEDEGLVGIIYMDLFYRENKTPTPAHFTVCCSRKIYPEELDTKDPFNLKRRTFQTTEHEGEIYQLPVISVVCNFFPDYYVSSRLDDSAPTLLTLNQVGTLFHEMGHAMHSMLGRTNLHNVSGTRCVTDFVELPSILTEQFAKDERVLLSFARHYRTGKRLPLSLLRKHETDNDFLNQSETFGQIKMAMLDEILHSSAVFAEDFDVVKIYHQLESEMGFFNDSLSNWPGRFGHLYSYGSVYYSYLLDRAIAAKIWEHLFEKDPMSRVSGEKFKTEVLRWGGCKDPWNMVANVLDKPELEKGDLEAMQYIGKATTI